ncbi:MAG: hypothetical protein D6738_06135 [Acidobacteria bacterium]|nr:MAG: hypothetical protein D6738_06135 [Acidobacteriota bacterium]
MAEARSGRRRWRRAGLVLLVLVAGAASAAWLLRDEPRRRVERALSERLATTVRVASLRVLGAREVELGGVAIGPTPLAPEVSGMHIRRLLARGPLRAMIAGRYDELVLSGVDVALAAPRDRPAPVAADESSPTVTVGRLAIEGLVVRLADEPPLSGTLSAAHVGTDRLSATLVLDGPSLGLAPLAAVARVDLPRGLDARVREVHLEFEHARQGSALRVACAGGTLRRDARTLDLPRLEMSVRRSSGDEAPVRLVLALGSGAAVGPASADVTWDPRRGMPVALEARIERLDLAAVQRLVPEADRLPALAGTPAVEVQRDADGWVGRVTAQELRARIPGGTSCRLADLRGELTAPGTWPPELDGSAVELVARVDACDALPDALRAADLLPGTVRVRAVRSSPDAPLAVAATARPAGAGRIEASGTVATQDGTVVALDWSWHDLAWSRVRRLAEGVEGWPDRLEVAGDPPALSGHVEGSPSAARASLAVEAGPVRVLLREQAGLAVSRFAASGRFAWSDRGLAPGAIRISAEGTADVSPALGRAIAPVPLRLELAAEGVDGGAGLAVEARGVAFDGGASASYAGVWRGGPATRGRLEFELADLFGTARALGALPATGSTNLRGPLRGAMEVATDDRATATAEGTLEASGFEVSSADGSRVVQGLATTARLRAVRDPDGRVVAEADGEVGGALVLWNSVFADLSAARSRLRLRGEIDPATGAAARIEGAFPSGPAWSVEVARSRPAIDWTAHLEASDLSSVWDALLLPVVESAWPETAPGAELAGRLVADLAGHVAPEEHAVRGSIRLGGGRAHLVRPALSLEGLELELPVALSVRDGKILPPDDLAEGRFALAGGSLAGIPLSPIDTSLRAGGGRIELSEPLRLSLLGGFVELADFAAGGLLSAAPRISASVHLAGLELAELPEGTLPFEVEGRIDARFPDVRIGLDRFEAGGGGTIAVFGGQVRLGDITGRDLFTRYPRVAFDAEFDRIDLGLVTRRVGFGEITGHVDGHIRDCELVGGVPVRFAAELRSSRMRRDRRTVTVHAVRNLTILGSGGSASALDRGITRFFDRFTYSRLGIAMSLADDLFRLRGLERRGNRELFMRGRLPLPIDVVNADPGRPVSFRAMLERLRSLDLERATTTR